MDFVNTVKVSNTLATMAYAKALKAFDALLPELKALAGEADVLSKERYEAALKRWQEGHADEVAAEKAWKDYDAAMTEWDEPGIFRTRGPAPRKPDCERPGKYSSMYRLSSRPERAYFDIGIATKWLDDVRASLKGRYAAARVAMAPLRVDHKTAVLISECEDGSYIDSIRKEFDKLIAVGRKQ